jgi:hypothetical protein
MEASLERVKEPVALVRAPRLDSEWKRVQRRRWRVNGEGIEERA